MDITVSDAFKIASAVLLSIGGGGVFGRFLSDRSMQKYKAAQDQELEKLKSNFEATNRRIQADLDKTVHVYGVQFETEFKALSDIWAKLSAVRSSLAVSAPHYEGEHHSSERLKQMNATIGRFTDAADAFIHAVDDQSPFYPREIYGKLEEIIAILQGERKDLERSKDQETHLSVWLDVSARLTFEKIVPLAEQISDLIRERIENLSLYRG